MSFRIDKGIKIPEIDRESGTFNKYPFERMIKGDSFLIKSHDLRKRNNLASSVNFFIKTNKPKWKFTVRKVKNGFRIWRIK